LAAWLRPDPLRKLKRSPDPVAAVLLKEGKGKGGEVRKGMGAGEGRGPNQTFWLRHWDRFQDHTVVLAYIFLGRVAG